MTIRQLDGMSHLYIRYPRLLSQETSSHAQQNLVKAKNQCCKRVVRYVEDEQGNILGSFWEFICSLEILEGMDTLGLYQILPEPGNHEKCRESRTDIVKYSHIGRRMNPHINEMPLLHLGSFHHLTVTSHVIDLAFSIQKVNRHFDHIYIYIYLVGFT